MKAGVVTLLECFPKTYRSSHLLPAGPLAIPPTARPSASTPETVKKFNGRDALRRVRVGFIVADAEHRVPTGSRLYDQPNFSQLPSQEGIDPQG